MCRFFLWCEDLSVDAIHEKKEKKKESRERAKTSIIKPLEQPHKPQSVTSTNCID
jgi:hypothetical protein